MADVAYGQTETNATDRIDRALARIEAATAARDAAGAALERRHDALRARMAEAIAALDAVMEREQGLMADVTLTIGDRRHTVACPDGQEDQVRRLGTLLDAQWATAARASGGLNGERTMLFVALMLADALEDADRRPADARDEAMLARIADRLESLAATLEQ